MYFYIMIPGSKGINPHELAHRWVGLWECEARNNPQVSKSGLLTPTSYNAI